MKDIPRLLVALLLACVLFQSAFPLDRIASTQLGFTPGMKKRFSSPVVFSSFELRRTLDSAVVYTGSAPVRRIISSVIGGDTVWIGDFSSFSTPGRYFISAGGEIGRAHV